MFASTENPIVIKPPPMRTGPGKQQNHLQSYIKVGKKKSKSKSKSKRTGPGKQQSHLSSYVRWENMNYRSQQKVGYSCTPP